MNTDKLNGWISFAQDIPDEGQSVLAVLAYNNYFNFKTILGKFTNAEGIVPVSDEGPAWLYCFTYWMPVTTQNLRNFPPPPPADPEEIRIKLVKTDKGYVSSVSKEYLELMSVRNAAINECMTIVRNLQKQADQEYLKAPESESDYHKGVKAGANFIFANIVRLLNMDMFQYKKKFVYDTSTSKYELIPYNDKL